MQSKNRVADAKHFNNNNNNNMIVAPSTLPSAGVLGLMNESAQSQPQPLKCPRCDSSNTKFCYYNNYSLSQPRHFCKSCKRYWTRGGTLRNVPVGGGCRKNKRVKRPTSSSSTTTTTASNAVSLTSSSLDGSCNSTTSSPPPTIPNPHMSHHFPSSGHVNPLLYGLSDVTSGINLPIISTRFSNSKGFESDFGFHGHSNLGLGFPNMSDHMSSSMAATSKPFLSGLFGSLSSSSSTPSMAALLASSTLHPHKLINGVDHIPRNSDQILGQNHLQTLASLQDLHVGDNDDNNGAAAVLEREVVKLDHQISGYIGFPSDPSNYNTNAVGSWLDPTANMGSSLTSLI